MNWLAHLHLSKPTAEYRLGNLLPDFARPWQYRHLSNEILDGVACHNFIDAFTDTHPVFRRSINRLSSLHRRFGGIVIDILYDHFLTVDWRKFNSTPLTEFVAEVHEGLARFHDSLPQEVSLRFRQIRDANILTSYADLDGIETALFRMNHRLRGNLDAAAIMMDLRRNEYSLRADFKLFFPELRERVAQFQEGQAVRIASPVRS